MKNIILDFIDFEKVNTLLEGFNKSTGFVTAILDLDGNVLSKSGWRQICTDFHRVHPVTSEKCTISDTKLAGKMAEGEKYHFYKCLNGLVDVAVPLIIKGEHIANLFSGQFFFEEPDIDFFRNQAEKYQFKNDTYLKALEKVPVVSEEKVKIAMDFLLEMTLLISEMTQQRIDQIELNDSLKENEEKFRNIFERSIVGKSMTTLDGKLITNKAFRDILGYSADELSKLKWQDITHPDDVENDSKNIAALISGEKTTARWEKRYIHKSGRIVWVDISTVLQHDQKGNAIYFITGIIDITERKLIQIKLIESQNRFQKIAEVAGEWIWEVDINGMYTYASEVCKAVLGYMPEELVGKKYFYDFFIPEEKEVLKKRAFEVFSKREIFKNFQNTNIHKNGTIIILQTSGSPILNEQNELLGYRGVDHNITVRKRIENKLRSSEERYKNFISQISEGVYRFELDKPMPINLPIEEQIDYLYNHSFIAECNTAFIKMYGLKESKEILGKSQLQLHGGSANHKNREAIRLFIESGYRSENNETEEPNENGQIRYYLNSSIGIVKKGHLIRQWGTQRDVTALKKSEQELIKLSSAVEQSPVSIIITDLEGKIEYVNQKFVEVTGYSFEEAIGNNPRILNSGEKPKEEYQKLWETIKSGKSWTGEFHNRRKNGEFYWESALIAPIVDKSGGKKYYLAIKEDITEKKEMMNDLVIAKYRAEESDRLKSAFIANMSHEIRTPMNGILGFTGLLKSSDLSSDQQQKYIKIIEKSGARLLTTINDIMDISKIEAGLVKISLSEININNQTEDLYTFFKPEADKKGLHLLAVNSMPEEDSIVKSDKEKVQSILINLIKNAIKFTKEGFVEFGCSKKGNQLEFYVKDTGVGIPLDRQSYIFDRFIQADIEDKAVYEGSGLGLAISKSYAEMLGGSIALESTEGIGSIFRFTLPYQTDTIKHSVVNIEKPRAFEESEIPALKILVVEDDAVAQLYIEELLTDVSKEILLADNGYRALDVFRENSDEIDLILMDIRIPGINGYEVTRKIRESNKDVIIIAQTAFALSGDREKALDAGCNDYISKPLNNKELFVKINKYFK